MRAYFVGRQMIIMMVANVVKCCTRILQRLHCTHGHRKAVTGTRIIIYFVVRIFVIYQL